MAKTNKKFMLLSAVGIIMVVDVHCYGPLSLFCSFLPYNSFFMPMFMFISGYFNKVDKDTDLWKYTKRKTRTLLLPYFVISFLAFFIERLIICFKTGTVPALSGKLFLQLFTNAFTSGEMASIAAPMWFVPLLFTVQIIYAVVKKTLYNYWNDKKALILFALLHIFVVWYVTGSGIAPYKYLPFKVLFFLVFLEMGIFFRDVLEEKLKKVNPLLLMTFLLLVNMTRIIILPSESDIAFRDLSTLTGFTSPYPVTPLISSIVGILFWLEIVELIGPPLYENRIINYISKNTFFIMGFHIIFFNLLNCVLFSVNKIIALPDFDVSTFQRSNWYRWEYVLQFRLAYFLAGLFGSLALRQIYDRFIKKPVSDRVKKRKQY